MTLEEREIELWCSTYIKDGTTAANAALAAFRKTFKHNPEAVRAAWQKLSPEERRETGLGPLDYATYGRFLP